MKIYLNRKHRTIGMILCTSCSPQSCILEYKVLCKNKCNPLLHPILHPILHPTLICSIFYPQTFNLFELLWQSEGLNPKPIELNTMYYVKHKCTYFFLTNQIGYISPLSIWWSQKGPVLNHIQTSISQSFILQHILHI